MTKSRKKAVAKVATEIATGGMVPQLQDALSRADRFIGVLAGTATDTIESVQKQASVAIEGLRSSLDGLNEGSLSNAQDAAKATISYVRKHPWQSAAVAVGIGVTAVILREGSRRLH